MRLHQEQLRGAELGALRGLPEPGVLHAQRQLDAVRPATNRSTQRIQLMPQSRRLVEMSHPQASNSAC